MKHISHLLVLLFCLLMSVGMAQTEGTPAQPEAEQAKPQEIVQAEETGAKLREEAGKLTSALKVSVQAVLDGPPPQRKDTPMEAAVMKTISAIIILICFPWGVFIPGVFGFIQKRLQKGFTPLPLPAAGDAPNLLTMETPEISALMDKLPTGRDGQLLLNTPERLKSAHAVLESLIALPNKGTGVVEYANKLGTELYEAEKIVFCLEKKPALILGAACIVQAAFLYRMGGMGTIVGSLFLLTVLVAYFSLWAPAYFKRKPLSQRYINLLSWPIRTDIVRRAVLACDPTSPVTAGYVSTAEESNEMTQERMVLLILFAPFVLSIYTYAVVLRRIFEKS